MFVIIYLRTRIIYCSKAGGFVNFSAVVPIFRFNFRFCVKAALFILISVLLLQPLLDSFDVADHNAAFNQASVLLSEEIDLEAHCAVNGDHQLHQAEHLSEPTDVYFTKIESLDLNFKSADLAPLHRPPIFALT